MKRLYQQNKKPTLLICYLTCKRTIKNFLPR